MLSRCRSIAVCGAIIAILFASHSRADRLSTCETFPQAPACERKDKAEASGKRDAPKKEKAAPSQKALLKSAIDGLAAQRPGTADLYTIAVAAWAEEDVFLKEVDGALASLAKVLPIAGRAMRLVNDRTTARTTPLATGNNLAAAVRSVAQIMDRDEDVLVLFMTSHGTREGIGLQLPGREPVLYAPRTLARLLDGAKIKNRVVIISACYSGIFLAPLANDNSIVLTAADPWNVSFGCAPGREWTFFGDALFNRNLRPGADLQDAFNNARFTISQWEAQEGFRPSNPQGHFGPALMQKLAPLYAPAP